jgi:hypothetical protein
MIEGTETLLINFALTIGLFSTLLFLPALIELKKPQDAGPRLITTFSTQMPLSAQHMALFDLEDELESDCRLTGRMGHFFDAVPSLEQVI